MQQIQAISQHGDTKLKGERANLDIDTYDVLNGE